MARMTQYIGLNAKAVAYLAVNEFNRIENPRNYTTGMFDEVIPLGTWERTVNGIVERVLEVEQISPWSSGPMIFTCLTNTNNEKIKDSLWILDSTLGAQYSYTNGTYYV